MIFQLRLRKKFPYSELFWYVFSRSRTDNYSVSLRFNSECRGIRTKRTPNTDTFHAVSVLPENFFAVIIVIIVIINFFQVDEKIEYNLVYL